MNSKAKKRTKKLIVFCGIIMAAAMLLLMPIGAFAESASGEPLASSSSTASSSESAGSSSGEAGSIPSVEGDGSSLPESSPDTSSIPEEEPQGDIPSGPSFFSPLGITPLSLGNVDFKVSVAMVSGSPKYTLTDINLNTTFTSYGSISITFPKEFNITAPAPNANWGTATHSSTATTKSITYIIENQATSGTKAIVEGFLKNSVSFTLATAGVYPPSASKINVSVEERKIGVWQDTNGNYHYYELISNNAINWTAAYNAAQGKEYMGLSGYLATITSQAEQDYIFNSVAKLCGWLGGTRALINDSGTVRKIGNEIIPTPINNTNFVTAAGTATTWYWASGPESGQEWYATPTYNATSSSSSPYQYWAGGEPNNSSQNINGVVGEFFLQFAWANQATWNDYSDSPAGTVYGYYVEYGGTDNDKERATINHSADVPAPVFTKHVKEAGGEFASTGVTAIGNIGTAYSAPKLGTDPTGYTYKGLQGGSAAQTGSYSANQATVTHVYSANQYQVSFNQQYSGAPAIASQQVTYDAAYGTLPSPTRTGYTFKGWYLETGLTTQVTSTTVVKTAGNHTLYAKWEAKTINLTYNLNYAATPPAGKTVTYDAAYGALPNPTRTGYTFLGWNTAANGTGDTIVSTTTVKKDTDHTLYAQWEGALSVTFVVNGGAPAPTAQTKLKPGDSITKPADPTKAGLTFGGWYESATFAGSAWNFGSGTMGTTNKTLYAKWTATVTYNANGGTGAPTDSTVYTENALVTVQAKGGMSYAGYDFLGWSETQGASVPQYVGGNTFNITKATTLYAVWKGDVDVAFNSQGGSTVPGITGLVPGSKVVKPADPTQAGYSFLGWYKEAGCVNAWNFATDTVGTSNITLYAKWEGALSVTFVVNGGAPAPAAQTKLKPGDSIVKPADPTKAGLTFGGWYESSTFAGSAWNFGSGTMGTTSKTLYAKWTARVTYNASGGTGAPTDSTVYTENATVTTQMQGGMSHSGYNFLGWSTQAGGNVAYAAGGTFTITKDTTLYAVWEGNLTVTFATYGGSPVSPLVKLIPGSLVAKPADPTKAGLTFGGWYKEASYATEWNFATGTLGTTDMTLHAKWVANVVYNANGGTGAPVDSTVYKEGSNVTVSGVGLMSRTGYAFLGWSTSPTGSVTHNAGTIFTINANTTLYAVWKGNVDVSFNSQGGSAVASATGLTPGSLVVKPADPTKPNLSFAGWYKEAGCTNAWNFGSDTVGTSNITLYAKWVADVTYDSQGGSSVAATTGVHENSKISAPANPNKAGLDFSGWYKEAACINAWDYGTETVTGNMTLYAKWTAHLAFDSQGGSAVATISGITPGTTVSAPTAPTKLNYSFAGWYKEAGCINAWNFGTEAVTQNATLYAKWTLNYWTVKYQGPAGSLNISSAVTTVAAGSSYQVTGDIPSLEGHDFTGWKRIPADTTYFFDYKENSTFTMPDCDVILEAVFVKSAEDDGAWSKSLSGSSSTGTTGSYSGGGVTGGTSSNSGSPTGSATGNTPSSGAQGIIGQPELSTSNSNTVVSIPTGSTPLTLGGNGGNDGWSLVNLIATILAAVFTLFSIILIKGRGSKLLWLIISAVITLASVLVLIFTSNFASPMVMINYITPLFLVLVFLQVVAFTLYARKPKKDEEEEYEENYEN